MSPRPIAWVLVASAAVVLTGWLASLVPWNLAGAWAAVTLFPGWMAYTVLTGHSTAESLGIVGGIAVTLGSVAFWTLLGIGVTRLARRGA